MLAITDEQLAQALPKISNPLDQYLELQELVVDFNNSESETKFRRKFGNFYRIRGRDAPWRHAYFDLLVQMRGKPLDFRDCLSRLQSATGQVEASFASKLLATLDPTRPVIDKIVLGHLGLKLPYYGANRIGKATGVYQSLTDELVAYMNSRPGKHAVAAFRECYREAAVTDIKIIDLILWQTRSVKSARSA
jgi:hypothetical protein